MKQVIYPDSPMAQYLESIDPQLADELCIQAATVPPQHNDSSADRQDKPSSNIDNVSELLISEINRQSLIAQGFNHFGQLKPIAGRTRWPIYLSLLLMPILYLPFIVGLSIMITVVAMATYGQYSRQIIDLRSQAEIYCKACAAYDNQIYLALRHIQECELVAHGFRL